MAVVAEQLASQDVNLAPEHIGETTQDYLGLIKRIREEESALPQTAEEAVDRLLAARDLYKNLPAPEVDMPDSRSRTLKELLADREAQYWLDRGEVREHGGVVQHIGFDTGTRDSMYRLIANL